MTLSRPLTNCIVKPFTQFDVHGFNSARKFILLKDIEMRYSFYFLNDLDADYH